MPRGGRRSGKPGQSYPNRSDLPTAPDPGAGTFKGQPYGAATAQAQVQGGAPSPGAGAPPGPPAAPPGPAPGSLGQFSRPTDRPTEPITAGLATGPGAGPEALSMGAANPDQGDLLKLAVYLPALELLASQPDASMATKNFVRRLRGAAPIPEERA